MRYLLFFFALTTLTCSTNSGKDFDNRGAIIAYDVRRCDCCGGWYVVIEDSTYRFKEMPEDSDLELGPSTEYPINIELNWSRANETCMSDELIMVSDIQLLN